MSLYFDPHIFVSSVFDPIPNFIKQIPWFIDHYPYHPRIDLLTVSSLSRVQLKTYLSSISIRFSDGGS